MRRQEDGYGQAHPLWSHLKPSGAAQTLPAVFGAWLPAEQPPGHRAPGPGAGTETTSPWPWLPCSCPNTSASPLPSKPWLCAFSLGTPAVIGCLLSLLGLSLPVSQLDLGPPLCSPWTPAPLPPLLQLLRPVVGELRGAWGFFHSSQSTAGKSEPLSQWLLRGTAGCPQSLAWS